MASCHTSSGLHSSAACWQDKRGDGRKFWAAEQRARWAEAGFSLLRSPEKTRGTLQAFDSDPRGWAPAVSGRVHRILRTGSRLSIWGTCFIYTMASTPLTKPGRRYHSDFTKDKTGQGVSSVSQAAGWPELPDSDYSGSRIFRLAYPSPVPCSTALSPRPGLSVNKSQLLHQT